MSSKPSGIGAGEAPRAAVERAAEPLKETTDPGAGSRSSARICAVVVHHRGREMLDRCLRALLASRGIELEVVVVANACREGLPARARSEARVHWVPSRRSLGFGAANNLGVAWARRRLPAPDAYFFVNDDAEVEAEALALLVRELRARPGAGIVGPRLMILGSGDRLNSLGLRLTEDGWAADEGLGRALSELVPLPATRPVAAVTGAALLVERRVYERLGGWRTVFGYYFEDVDLCLRAWARGYEVVNVPAAAVWHRLSATMGSGARRKRVLFERNRLLTLLLHWPGPRLRRALRTVAGREAHALRKLWRDRELGEVAIKLQAWASLCLSLPRVGWLRARHPQGGDWTALLEEPGSLSSAQGRLSKSP